MHFNRRTCVHTTKAIVYIITKASPGNKSLIIITVVLAKLAHYKLDHKKLVRLDNF